MPTTGMISCSGYAPTPNTLMASVASGEGKLRGSLPKVNSTTLSRTMPPAIVAINQALEPRSANGRTRKRSTAKPNTPHSASAMMTANGIGQPSVTAKV